jgi:hypothetical protein
VAGHHDCEDLVNKWIKTGLLLSGGLLLAAGLAVGAALKALKPQPGEWTQAVHWGPFARELSMPALLRIATHPFALRLMEGRSLRTPAGTVHWRAGPTTGTWEGVCAPCRLRMAALGPEPVTLARVAFTVVPDAEMNLRGDFTLGDEPQAVRGHWESRIETQQLLLRFSLRDQPMAHAFALFRPDIPELARVRIDGRLNATAQFSLPSRAFTLKPRIDGFSVSGLGTEALLNAAPGCAAPADAAGFGTWLPRAVIAAEDQNFHEHPGFDLAGIVAAWTHNGQPATPDMVGGSTLSQQLAKLLYTGDSRHHGRKLRELLYAVELDRTLGKARVLDLYLAIAPWGHGQCGAHAAARELLHKPVDALTPMEAVWLATLLHTPDRELAQMARDGQPNTERVAWVADQLRQVPVRERQAMLKAVPRWSPPAEAFTSAMAVAASRAADGR